MKASELKVGKRYVRRDGKTTGPLRLSDIGWRFAEGPPYADGCQRVYAMDGKHNPPDQRRLDPQCDIVAEYNATTPAGCTFYPTYATYGTATISSFGMGSGLGFTGLTTAHKDTPMPKRTLPTFTLDQVFEVLRAKNACWYTDLGPVKLVHKLNSICPSSGNAQLTLRDLVRAVQSSALPRPEALWLIERLPHIKPTDLTLDWNTDAEATLTAWEYPTPPKPRLSELKPGTHFAGPHGPAIKVNGTGWGEICADKQSTLHVTLDGCLMWSSANHEVDIIK